MMTTNGLAPIDSLAPSRGYRVPIIPLLALLAANGVQWSVRRLRSRGRHHASSPALATSDAEAVPNSSA
jgi:hypothetical protein